MKHDRSVRLYNEAQRYLPGGVDSPVRAFKGVGGRPIFIKRGEGSKLYDEDGNEFIDYVSSWGPLIVGHAHPQVITAIKRVAEHGTSFGASTSLETTLAKMVCDAVPSIEMVRFVNSGTEAVMSAVRLARAFTNRDKILKFEGCYHGHSDGLLAKAGSGLATLGIPDSPGVPVAYCEESLVVPFNDIDAVEQSFKKHPDKIAAVIIEPVAANMGVVKPKGDYLQQLRQLTKDNGSLLIFDEVITGFRLAYGGAQAVYGVMPDLTCMGKIIGGGLPVGAYGGRRDILEMVAPLGSVYQAGTLSGNPLAMAAGIETLRLLGKPGIYDSLETVASKLVDNLSQVMEKAGINAFISRIGSMFTIFFASAECIDYESVQTSDRKRYGIFFHRMLENGIYLPPSQFEACFVSMAHSDDDINKTIRAMERSLATELK